MRSCEIHSRPNPNLHAMSFAYQAKTYISLIEDPLWKQVCDELMNMMGPLSVLSLWNCNLSFSYPLNKSVTISCQDKEAVYLIEEYDFVIINSLRRYFPGLSELRVEISSQ